jgi:hypothetical protein
MKSIKNQVWDWSIDQVIDQVWGLVFDQVGDHIWNQVGQGLGGVRGQVWDQICRELK